MLMTCGHSSNALKNGQPYCIICDCEETVNEEIIEGRESTCVSCSNKTKSSYDLPFFKYHKNQKYDSYYCGCKGWD